MTVLIGLIGNSGTGKDTMADIIAKQYPNVVKRAFAAPVKDVARELFQFNDEQLYGNLKDIVDPRWNISPREAFQIIGTNIMQFGIYSVMPQLLAKVPVRHFWVYHFKMFFQEIKDNQIVIVPDVRFQHDADIIRELGGTLIKINRSINMDETKYNHLSEQGLNDIIPDYIIENNGSISKFESDIYELMNMIHI